MHTNNLLAKLAFGALLVVISLLACSEGGPAITQGTIIARLMGPNQPTTETALPASAGTVTNFLVALKVVDVRDNFAKELKGKTIRLQTCEFSKSLLGKTVALRVSHSRGRYPGSNYWLVCTSIQAARLGASERPKQ